MQPTPDVGGGGLRGPWSACLVMGKIDGVLLKREREREKACFSEKTCQKKTEQHVNHAKKKQQQKNMLIQKMLKKPPKKHV